MRKKDIRNCSPFESSSNTSEQLPSLDVQEYKRYWCANYTHKIGADAKLAENNRCDLREDIAENIMPMESDTVVAPMDKSIKISQKKRNMFQENGRRFGMNNIDGKSAKRSKACKKVMRRSCMKNVVTNSCPGDNGFDREQCCLQSGRESVNIKHTSKKDSGVSRRKHNQQAQVVSACSLQILLEGKNSDLDTNGSGANVLIQPSHASPSIEKVQCHLRNNNKSLHTKKHSDLNNLLEDTPASSHMNVISHPENEVYLKQKLCQTLSSFKGADIIQRKNIPCCPLTILKGDKRCDFLKENGVKLNQSSKKGVIPIVRQPIVVQSRRNGFINVNLNYKQEIHISPNPLQQKNHQIQKLVEASLPDNKINLNEVQNHSNVAIPQSNQQPMKPVETGQSTYVTTMGNMEMFKNRHKRSHLQTQNGVIPWINPVSTTFHPFYDNDGFLRDCTAMTQVKEQPIKLSNSMQVSSHVPTGWRLQNVKKSNPKQLSIAQNTTFRHYNLQNNCNHENHKRGQDSLGTPQKGKTISDLKRVNPMRVKDMSIKGMRSLNPYFSEGMSATQLSKYQERPFIPYNIHQSFLEHGNPSIYNGLKDSSSVFMGGFTEVQSSRQHVSYFQDQGESLEPQEKKRKAHALEQLGGRKLQQPASSTGLLNITRDSDSKIDLMQVDDISKILNVGDYTTPATISPIISIPKKDPPCIFNQNPADIADADDKRYFRTAENQRIWDKSSLQEKSGVDVKLDDRHKKRRKERPGRMPVVGLKC